MDEKGSDIMIISAECWQCNEPMLVALSGDDAGNLFGGPEVFSEDEKKAVEKRAVLLRTVSSKMAGETYMANVCGACNAFVGQFFYFSSYYTPALYGHYAYKRISSLILE